MGVLARRGATSILVGVFMIGLPHVAESRPSAAQAQKPAAQGGRRPTITGGQDSKSAWMVAGYRQLQVRKRSFREPQQIVTELRAGSDVVNLTVSPEAVTVTRNGRTIVIDSAQAMESLQQLLGGSAAVFATKMLLSELEAESDLEAPEMSLLSVAAFVASLVGDIEAPRRLSDRFVAKHRGLLRQIGGGGNGSCWSNYTVELTGAWGELQTCMDESRDDPWWWAPIQRLSCNGIWLMRSESAWFEYLKCVSPMSNLPH